MFIKLFMLFFGLSVVNTSAIPNDQWNSLSSEHFVINFKDAHKHWAEKALHEAEFARKLVLDKLNLSHERKVSIFVVDPFKGSSGYALPNRETPSMVLFVTPPTSDSYIGQGLDWQKLSVLHEYIHLVHLSGKHATTWKNHLESWVDVEPSVPRSVPEWIAEGYAIHMESKLTGKGRLDNEYIKAMFDQYAINGALPGYDELTIHQADYNSAVITNIVSGLFFRWLEEKVGVSNFEQFWEQWRREKTMTFDDLFHRSFSKTTKNYYRQYVAWVTYDVISQENRNPSASSHQKIVHKFNGDVNSLVLNANKNKLCLVEDEIEFDVNIKRIRVYDVLNDAVDGSKKLQKTHEQTQINHAHIYGVDWLDDDIVIYSASDQEPSGEYVDNLYAWDLRSDKVLVVKENSHIRRLDISHDKKYIIAEKTHNGNSDIILIKTADINKEIVLVKGEEGQVYDFPKISREKNKIAYLQHSQNTQWQLVIYQLSNNEKRIIPLPKGFNYLSYLKWGNDENTLYFIAGANRRVNLYRYDLNLDQLKPVTDAHAPISWSMALDDDNIFYVSKLPDENHLVFEGIQDKVSDKKRVLAHTDNAYKEKYTDIDKIENPIKRDFYENPEKNIFSVKKDFIESHYQEYTDDKKNDAYKKEQRESDTVEYVAREASRQKENNPFEALGYSNNNRMPQNRQKMNRPSMRQHTATAKERAYRRFNNKRQENQDSEVGDFLDSLIEEGSKKEYTYKKDKTSYYTGGNENDWLDEEVIDALAVSQSHHNNKSYQSDRDYPDANDYLASSNDSHFDRKKEGDSINDMFLTYRHDPIVKTDFVESQKEGNDRVIALKKVSTQEKKQAYSLDDIFDEADRIFAVSQNAADEANKNRDRQSTWEETRLGEGQPDSLDEIFTTLESQSGFTDAYASREEKYHENSGITKSVIHEEQLAINPDRYGYAETISAVAAQGVDKNDPLDALFSERKDILDKPTNNVFAVKTAEISHEISDPYLTLVDGHIDMLASPDGMVKLTETVPWLSKQLPGEDMKYTQLPPFNYQASALSAGGQGENNCWIDAGRKYQVDPWLLFTIGQFESQLRPGYISHYGESRDIGIMQISSLLLPELEAFGIGEEDLLEPCTNIHVAAWRMKKTIEKFGSRWFSLAVYLKNDENADVGYDQVKYAKKIYENYAYVTSSVSQHKSKVARNMGNIQKAYKPDSPQAIQPVYFIDSSLKWTGLFNKSILNGNGYGNVTVTEDNYKELPSVLYKLNDMARHLLQPKKLMQSVCASAENLDANAISTSVDSLYQAEILLINLKRNNFLSDNDFTSMQQWLSTARNRVSNRKSNHRLLPRRFCENK